MIETLYPRTQTQTQPRVALAFIDINLLCYMLPLEK